MAANLSTIQENVITLLCYSDTYSQTVRNTVPIELYGGPFREIARRVYEFIDSYKKPPKDHIADLMADKLGPGSTASLYEDILLGIRDQKESLNELYVLSQLSSLVKRQTYRAMAIELAQLLQKDTDDALDQVERVLCSAKVNTESVFDPGTRLSDASKVLDFLDDQQPAFPTGIPELDKRSFGPTRKELWLYIAAAKRGKTWMLIQLAKMAAVHRLRVVHISLEMSETRVAQRYMQVFFAMAKRKDKNSVTKFDLDQLGRITGFKQAEVSPKLSMDNPHIRKRLAAKIKQHTHLLENIYVKQFPAGQLTVPKLQAYLDTLENRERFIPDLLIVDYPDLMDLDKDNYRLAIDEVYKKLRGIAVERNLALAIVSQGNRSSERAKVVKNDNVAEAWSKIAHADCVITYNQTDGEHLLKLARLYVSAGRNDEDKLTLVISQNYAMGTFAVDSANMAGSNYWGLLPKEEASP